MKGKGWLAGGGGGNIKDLCDLCNRHITPESVGHHKNISHRQEVKEERQQNGSVLAAQTGRGSAGDEDTDDFVTDDVILIRT